MTILDLYLMRKFIATFLFTLVALALLFVLIDLLERLDEFIDRDVSFDQAIVYYVYFLPYLAKLLIPVATLMAALFSTGRLATSNEITAMRSSGQSFWRFLAPFLFLSIIISVGELYFVGWVVPTAQSKKLKFERAILQKNFGASLHNLYFRDQPTRNTTIEYYDDEAKSARNVLIEKFTDPLHPRLLWKIDAPIMNWDSAKRLWIAPFASRREMIEDSTVLTKLTDFVMPFSIRDEQISRLQRETEELTFDETKDYIWTLKAGGKETRVQEIEYYSAWSFPFANMIMAMISVPFAAVRRRGGIAVNIAAAMVLAFAYIACTVVFQAVGSTLTIDPAIVGWSGNVLFGLIALLGIVFSRR